MLSIDAAANNLTQLKSHRLKSVLLHPWRYQARCPVKSSAPHKVKSVPQDGVRTFLPLSHLAMTKPAITRPARQFYYTSAKPVF